MTSRLSFRGEPSERVADADGKPLAGVDRSRSNGHRYSSCVGEVELRTKTDAMTFALAWGFKWGGDDGKPSPQTQAAIIFATWTGILKRRCVSRETELQVLSPSMMTTCGDGVSRRNRFAFGQTREVNFVMLPAARVSGTLIGEDDQPLKDYSVSSSARNSPRDHQRSRRS